MYVITPGAYPVQEQQTGGSVWRENSRELYNYLRRDMRDATSERKRLYPVNWSQHVLRTVPFVWAIARELATAYMQPPSRRFVGKDGEPLADDLVALIEAEYARAHVDEVMRTAHRHLVALNNATIWVWPTESGDLRLTLIAPHEQEVELRHPFALHEDDVGMWRWRIAMPVKSAPSTSVYAVGVVTHESAVWEATGELNGMGIYAEDGSMPFETLPVVMLRGTPPGPGEWWAPVPHDILDAQRAMNHDLTDVGHIARLQGYGQPYVRGYSSGETKDMQLGPETVIGLSGDTAEFGFASASPALDGYVTQVREYVTQVIGMNGMNPATFLKSAGITALAKQVELIDRENYRQEFKGILKAAEQRLYNVMRAVINYQRGAELWPEATVEVDYREPIVPADPLHDAQALQMLVELGQTGRVRARAQRDGVSLEEAARRMGQDRELDGGFSVGDVVEMGQPDVQPADQVVEMSAPAPEAQPMPADGAPPSLDVAPSADVQKAALNGAQVAELKALIVSVAMGEIPADTARAVILAAYPIDPASVDDMLSSLSGFTPRTPGA